MTDYEKLKKILQELNIKHRTRISNDAIVISLVKNFEPVFYFIFSLRDGKLIDIE